MKMTLSVFILGLTLTTTAQEGWQLGFELNPSYYMMLNETDNSAPPDVVIVTVPNILGAPRGWATGAKAFYGFNEYIGIQTGLRYSWGRQDYSFVYPNADPNYVDLPDGSITTELNYLQLPISFQFQLRTRYDDVFYFSAGVAPAWLFHYYEQYKTYSHTSSFPPDGLIEVTTQTDINSDVHFLRTLGGNTIYEYNNDFVQVWLYQKFVLFGVAEIGYKRYFNNGWGFCIGVNNYVSLSEPEVRSGARSFPSWQQGKYKKGRSDYTGDTIDDRAKTSLLAVGITIGLVYNFDW